MIDPNTPPDSATTAVESIYRTSDSPRDNLEKEQKFEPLERTPTHTRQLWKFCMRPANDEEPQ